MKGFCNARQSLPATARAETSFSVFRDKKGQFRVHSKDIISAGWHSNVDVKALGSLAGGFSYLKKYLLKNNDFERADSKALKTLALCWAFRKRAFSVSGQFRRTLSDLISLLHNSKKHLVQVSLSGEVIREEKFSILGFVPIYVIGLTKDVWFRVLDSEQIDSVEQFLSEMPAFLEVLGEIQRFHDVSCKMASYPSSKVG